MVLFVLVALAKVSFVEDVKIEPVAYPLDIKYKDKTSNTSELKNNAKPLSVRILFLVQLFLSKVRPCR